jgi:quercetin dioxygenase-like cupin family protein
MRSLVTALAFVAVAVIGDHESEAFKLNTPDKLEWKDGPASLPKGAKIAILEGDPSKDGPFVFRVKVPDGYRIPVHTHPKTERVTVISGTFNIGMGEVFDKGKTQAMPAGTYGYWEAGMKHFVWIKGETVAQFHGMGPWSIQYVNPDDDPRNQKKLSAAVNPPAPNPDGPPESD